MSNTRKLLLIVIALVLAIGAALPALAQTNGEVEIVGEVEAMSIDTITVNGQEMNVTGAEINTTIEIGKMIEIEGTLNPDGSISIREIDPVEEDVQVGEAELIGTVESFDGTTLVVNGQSIDVTSAEIEGEIAVDSLVKVHAVPTGSNSWAAREVEPLMVDDDDDDINPVSTGEFEIRGTLEEVGESFVVVAGQTISLTSAEVKDTLTPGVLVKVHVLPSDDGLMAREIENAVGDDDDDDDDNTSVTTEVSAQDASDMVIEIFPNTSIIEIELDAEFDDSTVWEIETSHGHEIKIDVQTGVILTIERDDDDDDDDDNSNSSSSDDDDDDDDNSNSSSSDDDDDDDDNSNSSSSDDDDDDDDDD